MSRIRVLITDDHPVFRRALAAVINDAPDMEVVGVAADGTESLRLAADLKPDVILMDIAMPGISGIEAVRRLTAAESTAAVIMVTSYLERALVADAVDAGARGYILKDVEPEVLQRSIREAAAEGMPISPQAVRLLLDRRRRAPTPAELTQRHREVLRLVANGLSNREVAAEMGLSDKTVKSHLTRIYAVLGVSSRTQAALWVARNWPDGGQIATGND